MQEVNGKNLKKEKVKQKEIIIGGKNKKILVSSGIRSSGNNTFSSIAIYYVIQKFTANK